jgi:hypothetical protein
LLGAQTQEPGLVGTDGTGSMAAPRRVIEIAIGEEELARLEAIARSRTEPACRVGRARILLAYCADPSAYAVGQAIGVTHQTVLRCLDRAVRFGAMAALDDSPRPGKAPEITEEARAWLVALACQKPKDLGYPHKLWTTRLLARHVREHAAAAGHPCLQSIVQGTVCKILARHELKPHKVRYYLERRDEAFETKMADVLCVYREVAVRMGRRSGTFWPLWTAIASPRCFAHCASLSINAVHEPWNRNLGRLAHADRLAQTVHLDMAAAEWRPTVENYLGKRPIGALKLGLTRDKPPSHVV